MQLKHNEENQIRRDRELMWEEIRFKMQEETGVPGENLRGRVWIGNQTRPPRLF